MSRLLHALLAVTIISASASADPCGMVPPIIPSIDPSIAPPIVRSGDQMTYVFYKDGIETFVIRPGFTGKVDEFGMLIPFPSPPAIRKVPNHIFSHIVSAADPPVVYVYDLLENRRMLLRSLDRLETKSRVTSYEMAFRLKPDQVRVVRREAVGMYEVAVIEAGSARALKRWMEEHNYRYPDGMDKACEEYVQLGWCFVAVKTKVGQKKGVDPKPGQRNVDSKLPAGATFNGHVQAMGFRFKVDELVVPMRLSTFNGGSLRNIVYLLTDGPRRIRRIPEEYVVRQIPGEALYKNVTQPLPVFNMTGRGSIPGAVLARYASQRNPVPHNGAAKELFAADLLAVRNGRLNLAHEEQEKQLLNVAERLGLRDPAIERLSADALKSQRDKTVAQGLNDLKKMTLTIIDGDFPREVLSKHNLKFSEYHMPKRRNQAAVYNSRQKGPQTPNLSELERLEREYRKFINLRGETRSPLWPGLALSTALLGLALLGRRFRASRRPSAETTVPS